jgi:signal transduction histidine kinase
VKKRKTKRTLPALGRRIACVILILWLACMYTITYVTAELYRDILFDMGQHFMEDAWTNARFSEHFDGDAAQLPGYTEYVLWEAVSDVGPPRRDSFTDTAYRRWYELGAGEPTAGGAVAIFDADGNAVAYSANFISFPYYDEEGYQSGDHTTKGYAVCVLDRQMPPADAKFRIEQSFRPFVLTEALCYRFTGVLENGYFTVWMAEYYRNPAYSDAGGGWVELPGFDGNTPLGAETVTLYADFVNSDTYEESRPFEYNDSQISGLVGYVSGLGSFSGLGWTGYFNLSKVLYINAHSYYDWSGWDSTAENDPELEYRLAVAMLASPWRSAMTALGNVYLVTLLIGLAGSLWLRKTLRRHVTQPVAAVNEGMAKGFVTVRDPDDPPLKYTEVAELTAHYEETKTRLAHNKDTIARLEKAVNYAQEAEENRRQMTSSIAHELKTPLAVIHSYAEGLRERIAEEKREKYLDVILSETERMDGMVLEMLDLSRLEAGKVRLLREDFSLSELTAAVFERLARAAEAKALRLTFELEKDCIIRADPARIEQVITNFAVNAVKYTPSGGSIRVYTARNRNSGVTLTVENDSEPLSREALSKVWDTFYRADESRTGAGTGLGLAIAKSIIDLHGGKCWVRNTKTGVAFSFELEA